MKLQSPFHRQPVVLSDEKPVNIILIDLRMPGMDGVSAMRAVRTRQPKVKMIVLTTFHHDEWIIDALNAGAVACFLKEIPPGLLTDAIRQVWADTWEPDNWTPEWRKYAPEIQFQVRLGGAGSVTETLTARELEVLRAICKGQTNTEIAAIMYLSEGTVKNYVSGLYQKLRLKHRAEAIRFARDKGLC